MFKYIFETLLLILLGIYPEVELLGYMPSLYLIFFEESPCYFPQWLYHVIVTHVVHTSSNFSTSCQQLLFCFVFDGSYLMDVKGYLTVVLICIDITISDVHLFLCVLAIWISFLRKCLFKSFAHFWIRLFVFGCLVLGVLCRLLILIPSQIYDLQIFSPFHELHFHSESVFLEGVPNCFIWKNGTKELK